MKSVHLQAIRQRVERLHARTKRQGLSPEELVRILQGRFDRHAPKWSEDERRERVRQLRLHWQATHGYARANLDSGDTR
jgi:hypothetical protein